MIDLDAYNGGSSALRTFLQGRPLSMLCADLTTVTLRPGLYSPSGATLRWTSSLFALSLGGNIYSPGPPNFKRPALRCGTGLEVSDTELTVESDDSVLLNGVPVLARIVRGEWDAAIVKLERAYSTGPGQPWLGRAPRFLGVVTDVKEVGRISLKLTVKNVSFLLDSQWPKDTIMSTCNKVLYGADCGISASSFQVAGTVGTAPTVNGFQTNLTQADDYFDGGTITFTSGTLAGLSYWIRSYAHTNGAIRLKTPALVAPGVGDTFTVLPGCDKSTTMCNGRFSNLANFGGFPWVPQPTTAF